MEIFGVLFIFLFFFEAYVSTLDEFNGSQENTVKSIVWGSFIVVILFNVIF